jgi:predicted house-cleaning noncanonical NTP pyrophosphatase (MazG superfamily)
MSKLVRDLIPEVIRSNGEEPVIEILTGRELIDAMLAKVVEEALELQTADADHQLEELADLTEIAEALRSALGITAEQLASARRAKSQARGAFERGYLLVDGH